MNDKNEPQVTPEGAIFAKPKAVASLPKMASHARKGIWSDAVEAFCTQKPAPKPGQWYQIAEQENRNTFGAAATIRNIAAQFGVDSLKVSERKDGTMTKLFLSIPKEETS